MTLKVHYPKDAVKKFVEDRFPNTDWDPAFQDAPAIIWRSKWNKYADKYGWPFRKGYMENLDSQGRGPASFVVKSK